MKEKKVREKEKKQVIKTKSKEIVNPNTDLEVSEEAYISERIKRQRLEKLCFKTYGDDLL